MTNRRGKWLIAGMLLAGLLMSGYAWWHQFQSGRRSAAYWGQSTAVLLRYAPQVEYIPLTSGESGPEVISIGATRWTLGPSSDITKTRGLVHARHALVDDLSYVWDARPPAEPQWRFLLKFRSEKGLATVAVSPDQGLVAGLDAPSSLEFVPKIATAFRQKGEEWARVTVRP